MRLRCAGNAGTAAERRAEKLHTAAATPATLHAAHSAHTPPLRATACLYAHSAGAKSRQRAGDTCAHACAGATGACLLRALAAAGMDV